MIAVSFLGLYLAFFGLAGVTEAVEICGHDNPDCHPISSTALFFTVSFFTFFPYLIIFFFVFYLCWRQSEPHNNWFALTRLWLTKHSPLSHNPPPPSAGTTTIAGTNTTIEISVPSSSTTIEGSIPFVSSISSTNEVVSNPHLESSSSSSSVILTNNNFRNQNLQHRSRHRNTKSNNNHPHPPPHLHSQGQTLPAAGSADSNDIDTSDTVNDAKDNGTNEWICSACTYACKNDETSCSMCGNLRNSSRLEE